MFELDRMPKADELGFFVHPDVPEHEDIEMTRVELARAGWEMCLDTAGDALYIEEGELDYDPVKTNAWIPVPDAGDGWLLVAVYDTEEGPYALFVRPAAQKAVAA
jgi:hypothetical protein